MLILIRQWHIANYIYLFNRLYKLYHGTNPQLVPPRVQDIMAGAENITEGFLADFPTPILSNIGGEPTI